MFFRLRATKQLVRMPPRKQGATQEGVKNWELGEFKRIIEDCKNKTLRDVEADSKSGYEIEEVHPRIHLISFMKDRGSTKVEVSCYDVVWRLRLSLIW